MKEHSRDSGTATLVAHIAKHLRLLDEAKNEINDALEQDIPKIGKSSRAGVLVGGLIENYYTCIETIFVRISQFFENNLSPQKWHRELLEKMTLQIDNIRPRVISESVFSNLVELMRFRHFKRYYFGTSYDWVRLEELIGRIQKCHPILFREIEAFQEYLKMLDS